MQECKEVGAMKLSLRVHATNAVARGLYLKMGFKEEGIALKALRNLDDGGYTDLVHMGYFFDVSKLTS